MPTAAEKGADGNAKPRSSTRFPWGKRNTDLVENRDDELDVMAGKVRIVDRCRRRSLRTHYQWDCTVG
jgi:hypothetical protein